jgi:putative FmdB family regulatory protein
LPTFAFACKKCEKNYTDLVPFDETGKYKDVVCPHCGSKSKTKLMTTCSFAFAQPEGTDRWNSESSGHDYRFHHKLPKVIEERMRAEQHRGEEKNAAYNPINDLENNDAWSEGAGEDPPSI